MMGLMELINYVINFLGNEQSHGYTDHTFHQKMGHVRVVPIGLIMRGQQGEHHSRCSVKLLCWTGKYDTNIIRFQLFRPKEIIMHGKWVIHVTFYWSLVEFEIGSPKSFQCNKLNEEVSVPSFFVPFLQRKYIILAHMTVFSERLVVRWSWNISPKLLNVHCMPTMREIITILYLEQVIPFFMQWILIFCLLITNNWYRPGYI